jgi:acyl dehydratase
MYVLYWNHETKDKHMAGLWFGEFTVGQAFDHEIRRTVTEADNMWFCNATYNPAAIHIDAEYCRTTEFGRPLVNSIFTLGLVIGLSVQDTTLGTTVANLGMTDVVFPKPVFAGDTLRSRTTVLETRPSKSRPNAGIVTFLHQGFNQHGDEVASCKRQALMLRQAA